MSKVGNYGLIILTYPVLVSLYFDKYFLVSRYASENTIADVLLQKND